jgi:hypothetical protein
LERLAATIAGREAAKYGSGLSTRTARSLSEGGWDSTTLVYQANMDSELRDDRSPAHHRKATQDYGPCSTLGSTEAYDRLDHLCTLPRYPEDAAAPKDRAHQEAK